MINLKFVSLLTKLSQSVTTIIEQNKEEMVWYEKEEYN